LARIALTCCALLLGLACAGKEQERPNVLLVMFDTLRSDHCSAYGYPYDTTPALRALAERGVRFTAAYAPTATTGPSTVSLFTSRYPATHRYLKNGLVLGDGALTLAELLRDAGYDTYAVVSSTVLAGRYGLLQGFEKATDRWPPEQSAKRPGELGERVEAGYDREGEYAVEDLAGWLREEWDATRPFFAFLHLMDPHEPYTPKQSFLDRVRGDRDLTDPHARRALRYDADIAYADAQLGRLLQALDATGAAEDTLIVVVADHGQGLAQHGWVGHGLQLYEEAVRVPFVAAYPGRIAPGTVIDEPVELLDVLPTILDYAGVEPGRARPDGVTLRGPIEGGRPLDPDRPVYLQRRKFASSRGPDGKPLSGEKFGLVWRGYKYIEAPGEGTFELYDLTADPGETKNLYATRAALAQQMAGELGRWRTRHERSGKVGEVSKEDAEALRALGYIE